MKKQAIAVMAFAAFVMAGCSTVDQQARDQAAQALAAAQRAEQAAQAAQVAAERTERMFNQGLRK